MCVLYNCYDQMSFTNLDAICLVLIVLLLISAQSMQCMSYDGIDMGCELKLDITRSEEGRPLSEAIVDFD
jgi:hypothetical protein